MSKEIEPKLKLVSDYLKPDKDIEYKFVIPEYQRGYTWNIVHCDKLWQDILNFNELKTNDPYFFGTIIVDCSDTNSQSVKKYSLIDGQQRTTTFLLLLKALQLKLQDVIENFKEDEDSENLKDKLNDYRKKTLGILFKANQDKIYKILKNWDEVNDIEILENNSINEQYKDELQKIISAKDFSLIEKQVYKIPKKQKDNKYTNYFKNFKFFYEQLSSYTETQTKQFAENFLDKCQVIEIRSWQIEQAITMFNSLNSTGEPLSDADIISAQMYSNAGDKKIEFNKNWEEIIRLSTDLDNKKIINIDSILQEFMYINRASSKEYINDKGNVDVTTPGLRRYYTLDKKEILKQPLQLCEQFLKIVQIWDKINEYPHIKLLLKFNENIKLYLISFLYRYDVKEISEKEVLIIAECLIRLFAILELVDTGYSSKNFKTFLFKENIKLVDKNISCEEIKNDFNWHILNSWKKDDIEELLLEYDKNILIFLNEYLYAKEKGLKFDFNDSVNIEHIMPASGRNIDTIRKDANIETKEEFNAIVNKLGNKIFLEEDINKSIGREWFITKKQNSIDDKKGYKDSKYNIAKALTEYKKDKWEKIDIEEATKKAVNRIINFIFDE